MSQPLTLEELTALLDYWTQRLRLTEWTFDLKIVRYHELSQPNRSAEVEWFYPKAVAHIRILDPNDYPKDCLIPQDMEASLVHELIHLRVAPLSVEDDIQHERNVQLIAQALVEEHRRGEASGR